MTHVRGLSLAAALALLPFAASAQETAASKDAAEARLEAAARTFEARMEGFGERAEAIAEDESLGEAQRGARMSALWAEYQPDVTAFTAVAAQEAGAIAQAALADIDMDALVEDALKDVDMKGAMASAGGIAANSAWTNPDPEQLVTYGLIADYAMTQASDAIADAYDAAAEAPEAPERPEAPKAPEAPEAAEI